MKKLPSGIILVKLETVNWLPEYYPRTSMEDQVRIPALIDPLKSTAEFDERDARAHLLGNTNTDAPFAVRAPRGLKFQWLLLDGARRLHAYHRAGRTLFPIEKHTDIPESRYFLIATQRNIQHGARLSPFEIRQAFQRLKEAGWNKGDLLEEFKITPASYKRMVANKEVTRAVPGAAIRRHDGFLKTPFSGLSKIRERQLAIDLQAPVAAKSVDQVINEMYAFLAAGVFDGGEWNEPLEQISNMIQEVLKGGKGRDAA